MVFVIHIISERELTGILNGVMAVILRYFTKLVYDIIVKQLPRFHKNSSTDEIANVNFYGT